MTDEPQAREHLSWVLGLTSTAYFMVVLDSVVVITALPRMQRDLHVSLTSLQWTLNAYGIAFAAGIITAAALGDRFGRRRVQGLGAAVVLPLSLTILTAAYPPEKRGMIVGVYGGLAGLAVALGPIVGGAITEGIDWHWIFWINVPIGLAALGLGMRLLPESYGAAERLDLVGVILCTAGVVAVVWALSRANEVGWASIEVVGTLTAGCLSLLGFAGWERSVRQPLVPPSLFGSRDFSFGNLTTFLMSAAIFAAGLLVTEEFQLARHYSPVGAGTRLLPFFGTPMIVSPIAGALSDRVGRRPIMVTGLSFLTGGFVWVAWRGTAGSSWVELVLALLVAGVGISMALPTVPTVVISAVARHEMGKASGINYMAQRLGAVFGVAVATAVFSAYGQLAGPAAVSAGFRPALWACTGLAALSALSALAITSARRNEPVNADAAELPIAA